MPVNDYLGPMRRCEWCGARFAIRRDESTTSYERRKTCGKSECRKAIAKEARDANNEQA